MALGDDKIVYVHLGEKIKKARTERKLSLRELAAICDVEHNTIHEIEKGTLNFRFSTIIKISKGLEIPLFELFKPH
jgi:transcriptional regulator with XRE-family HTH domain